MCLTVRLVKITRLSNLFLSGARESLRLFVFKKCAVEKNKKHRAGQRVGLDAVRL